MSSETDEQKQVNTPAEVALEAIMAFNRKERYHLIRHAVTGGPWSLTDAFRSELEGVLRGDLASPTGPCRIPDNAYVAMDYHLNWIATALEVAKMSPSPEESASLGGLEAVVEAGPFINKYMDDEGHCTHVDILTGNQEDTDLLVAFIDEHVLHLILVEAKAGSGWNSKQINSKGQRLSDIFERDSPSPWVRPYFVLVGAPLGEGKQNPNFSGLEADCPKWFFRGRNGRNLPEGGEAPIPYLSMQPQCQLCKPTRVDDSGEKWKVEKETGFALNDSKVEKWSLPYYGVGCCT